MALAGQKCCQPMWLVLQLGPGALRGDDDTGRGVRYDPVGACERAGRPRLSVGDGAMTPGSQGIYG